MLKIILSVILIIVVLIISSILAIFIMRHFMHINKKYEQKSAE